MPEPVPGLLYLKSYKVIRQLVREREVGQITCSPKTSICYTTSQIPVLLKNREKMQNFPELPC